MMFLEGFKSFICNIRGFIYLNLRQYFIKQFIYVVKYKQPTVDMG